MATTTKVNGNAELDSDLATSNGLKTMLTTKASSKTTTLKGRVHSIMKMALTIKESLSGTREKALERATGLIIPHMLVSGKMERKME
jgi:hypothetical protein